MNDTRFLAAHLAALSALACGSLTAQVRWSIGGWASALPRTDHSVVYDYQRNTIVMFGGSFVDRYMWTYDGANWRQDYAQTPWSQFAQVCASDILRQQLVVFVPQTNLALANDTYLWDGRSWNLVTGANDPPGRRFTAMAFDASRGRTVLFGGNNPYNVYSDTWEWDGTSWLNVPTATTPNARWLHRMCYDTARREIVLFGGKSTSGYFNDTWVYDGTDWTRRSPAHSPVARGQHTMVYDYERERVVLYGGAEIWNYFGDVWEWDGVDWTQRTPTGTAPGPLYLAEAAFDHRSGQIVFAGGGPNGHDRAFHYAPVHPAARSTFGTSCQGTTGFPHLTISNPWAGERARLRSTFVRPGLPAFVLVGFSNTASTLGALPLSLSSLGMPGCNLLVDPVFTLPTVPAGSVLEYDLPIPAQQSLLGRPLYAQVLFSDPGANALGMIGTNGAAGVIGSK